MSSSAQSELALFDGGTAERRGEEVLEAPTTEVVIEPRDLARALVEGIASHKKILARLERAAKGLDSRWCDPGAVAKELATLRKLSDEELPATLAEGLRALSDRGEAWLAEERAERRSRLAKELKAETAARSLRLDVVTREPLELWLAPLGVVVDIEKARASLQFGRQELLRCPTDAREILAAHSKALDALEREGWTPEGFHRELRDAWRTVSRRSGQGDGWVELRDVLPYLALGAQSERWRRDPKAKDFIDYGRAHFLYEIHKLRERGALAVDGWRLVLGPATGGSTRDKNRVFWIEDGLGHGTYHLTLRFAREEEIHGTRS